jgi:DNA-binding XRE family transcriptional regulator
MTLAKPYKELRDKIRSDPARAARVDAIRHAMEDALALAEIRNLRELTQEDIANAIGVSQANVSRVERENDLYLSTLQRYVEALGGRLEVAAVFDDERVAIAVGG